jgi:hypothetical protein
VSVVAYQFGGAGAGSAKSWDFACLIKNVAGTTSIVPPVLEIMPRLEEAGSIAWTCVLTASDPNDSLVITVTGEAAKDIHWTAYILGVEVG